MLRVSKGFGPGPLTRTTSEALFFLWMITMKTYLKRFVIFLYCHGLLSKSLTQSLFDSLRLQND